MAVRKLLEKLRDERKAKEFSLILVGLGNPGPEYAMTRHNAGFWVVDGLQRKLGGPAWERDGNLEASFIELRRKLIVLIKPQTFMNLSGKAVIHALQALSQKPEKLLIVHDELDLPEGRIQLKKGGSSGGNNGIQSIIESLGRNDFARLRMGIGRPTGGINAAHYVLKPLRSDEESSFEELTAEGMEAALQVANLGLAKAMNEVNKKKKKPAPTETKENETDPALPKE
jgi:PTH1 family peptidyl-tRNA hydrolase